jgi:hypothetical protein
MTLAADEERFKQVLAIFKEEAASGLSKESVTEWLAELWRVGSETLIIARHPDEPDEFDDPPLFVEDLFDTEEIGDIQGEIEYLKEIEDPDTHTQWILAMIKCFELLKEGH